MRLRQTKIAPRRSKMLSRCLQDGSKMLSKFVKMYPKPVNIALAMAAERLDGDFSTDEVAYLRPQNAQGRSGNGPQMTICGSFPPWRRPPRQSGGAGGGVGGGPISVGTNKRNEGTSASL